MYDGASLPVDCSAHLFENHNKSLYSKQLLFCSIYVLSYLVLIKSGQFCTQELCVLNQNAIRTKLVGAFNKCTQCKNSINAFKWLKRTKWLRLLTFLKEPTKMGKGPVLTTPGFNGRPRTVVGRLEMTDKGTNRSNIRTNIIYPK